MVERLEFKVALYIIAGVVAIAIVSLLLDGIKKAIRGLDIAALGALFVYVGYRVSQIRFSGIVSSILYLVGGTLVVVGILAFVLLKLFKRSRVRKKEKYSPPIPDDLKEKGAGTGSDAGL